MSKLAIILPIYKSDFLRETLSSLAAQTCRDFMAYICDDCSPFDLKSIVNEFEGAFPFQYIRFTENMGSMDLVSHWERCMSFCKEEWIWFFSDDDIMDSNCVESFYKYSQERPETQLFHFNARVIDSTGEQSNDIHFIKEDFPKHLTAKDFLRGRLSYRYNSFIIDYIFKQELLFKQGGFVHYDMAWCSDDATWYNLSKDSGIETIPTAFVYWRISNRNITPDHSPKTMLRKIQATQQHLYFCKRELSRSFYIRFNYFLHTLYNARELKTKILFQEFLKFILHSNN